VTALHRGVTQVVVAAAGYDGRAWRYSKPGVRWFEVDHPDTQADKQRRLRRLGIATDQVTFVSADFTIDPIGPRLAAAGIDPTKRSLMLCEGVASYLDLPVLNALLQGLAEVAARRSRLAISLSIDTGSGGLAERRARFQARVAALGEPVRTILTADGAQSLLVGAGWRPVSALPGPGPSSPGSCLWRHSLARCNRSSGPTLCQPSCPR
ncbi:MAG: class I SAM-dependent methyltransferase, partial [Acidimicrobiales bacterium]